MVLDNIVTLKLYHVQGIAVSYSTACEMKCTPWIHHMVLSEYPLVTNSIKATLCQRYFSQYKELGPCAPYNTVQFG